MMKMNTKIQGDVWIIEIDGPMRSGAEFDLAEELERCLTESKSPKIMIDMKKVTYVNSATLAVLLSIFREVDRINGRLLLCDISPEVENLLDVTKLGSVFEVFKNQEDAFESLED